MRLSIRNRFTGTVYPRSGQVEAVVDTGYDGFLLVPEALYAEAGFGEGVSATRDVYVADGRKVTMRSTVAAVEVHGIQRLYDGFIETGPGIGEVLAGARLLNRFRVTLDYCSGTAQLAPCG
ncbi:MAG: clan AA aspartic protease [Nitrososphaerota archaeon]|nr:clan AA aspartic protease [Nitrososphaerota archaeon]